MEEKTNPVIKSKLQGEISKKKATSASWKQGQSGNPKGRPKKGHSITEAVKEIMKSDPKMKKKLVNKVLTMALDGDIAAIRLIWQYLDGMPTQSTDISFERTPIPILGGISTQKGSS